MLNPRLLMDGLRPALLMLFIGIGASGCALLDDLGAKRYERPDSPQPVAAPAPVEPAEEPPAAPPPVGPPAPKPEARPDVIAEAVERPARVAVLLSSRSPDYERIASALMDEYGELALFDLSDKSLTQREVFEAIRRDRAEVVVAIGYRAAVTAASIDDLPVVFAQVFNTNALDLESDRIRGVSVLPPLDKQLRLWKELNPGLSSVGMIVGAGHDALVEEGRRAADAVGVRFSHRLAQSDRETLYLFSRLLPEIDGYWLIPDNRILSAPVLRRMISLANRHQVQVVAFNDSLLTIGATLSASPVDADVAATIIDVAGALARDDAGGLPGISPLSEVTIRTGVAPAAASAGGGQ